MTSYAGLLGVFVGHLALTGLPGAAAALFMIRRGVSSTPLLLCGGLVFVGLVGSFTFWAYFADPIIGKFVSWGVLIGSVLTLWWLVRRGLDWSIARRLAVPASLWALGSGFVIFIGFVHGGLEDPVATAGTRFSHQLPSDNELPRYFAEWIYAHGHGANPPPFSSWLSSDRPPLQMGFTLLQRPFAIDGSPAIHYQVLAVLVQQLWIVAAWALLVAAKVSPRIRGLAMLAAIVSDVGILHAFFVWPKLLAAAFFLASLALVVSERWGLLKTELWGAALFGSLCSLSMLAHGGSAFALIPLLGFMALRGMPSWRWLWTAAAVALVLLLPWSLYQKYADPPGDRLLKYQLAGVAAIDSRSAVEAIIDSYSEAGLDGTLDNKINNAVALADFDGTVNVITNADNRVGEEQLSELVREVRELRFFGLLPLLGALLLAIPAMMVARLQSPRDGPEWTFAVTSLLFSAAISITWILFMFGGPNATTVVHAGTLVLPLLALLGCVVGLGATYRRLAYVLVGINVVTVLLLYTPSLTPPPGSAYSPPAALLAALFLAGVGLVTLRGSRGSDPDEGHTAPGRVQSPDLAEASL